MKLEYADVKKRIGIRCKFYLMLDVASTFVKLFSWFGATNKNTANF